MPMGSTTKKRLILMLMPIDGDKKVRGEIRKGVVLLGLTYQHVISMRRRIIQS